MPESSGLGVLDGSFDGGRHWREVLSLRNGGEGWSDFGFTTPRQGVAVEAGAPTAPTGVGRESRLFQTRDGGRHWHLVRFSP